jgi:PleD family two-component response regulator
MTKPMALILYENLMPGSKLANRMQDLGYRVKSLSRPAQLPELAESEKPMVVFADLSPNATEVCAAITSMKQNPVTQHIPILAFSGQKNSKLLPEAAAAGANLVANSAGLLDQLPHLLEQILLVE